MASTMMEAATERMLATRGTEEMAPAHRRAHRAFVLFNTVLPLVGLGVAVVGLWGWGVTALDLALLAGFHVLTSAGITIGFHRGFAHKGFEAGPRTRLVLATIGTLAMQGPVIKWVAEHRRHHAFSDEDGDPHSPHLAPDQGVLQLAKGLWWAHVGWMFAPVRTRPERWAPDLLEDPVLRRVNDRYVPLVVVSLAAPALIGLVVGGTPLAALRAFVWGGLVRLFIQLHTTWSINSICHVFGRRSYRTGDEARNVWWLSLLSMGESWHNNHHAFPSSTRHGLDPGQVDVSARVIEALEALGLVSDARRPTPAVRARRRLSPGENAPSDTGPGPRPAGTDASERVGATPSPPA